jgi:hypothetical protein
VIGKSALVDAQGKFKKPEEIQDDSIVDQNSTTGENEGSGDKSGGYQKVNQNPF